MSDPQAILAHLTALSPPPKQMPLTALDYTAPQNYIMKSAIFPCSNDLTLRYKALFYLRSRLKTLFQDLPFLAGKVVHPTEEGVRPRLDYQENVTFNDDNLPQDTFGYSFLGQDRFPWTFQELSAAGVPAYTMEKRLFWLVPQGVLSPGGSYQVMSLAVSFFDDGLILGFGFHHGVVDGGATTRILELFANDQLREALYGVRSYKDTFAEYAGKLSKVHANVDPATIPGYDFGKPPTPAMDSPKVPSPSTGGPDSAGDSESDNYSPPPASSIGFSHGGQSSPTRAPDVATTGHGSPENLLPPPTISLDAASPKPVIGWTQPPSPVPAIAKVFAIRAETLGTLHFEVIRELQRLHGLDPTIGLSRTDVICALVWIHVIRARARSGRVEATDLTRFATAVDVRRRLPADDLLGPYPQSYLGNMFLRALGEMSVGSVLDWAPGNSAEDPEPMEGIETSVAPSVEPSDKKRELHKVTTAQIVHAAMAIRAAVKQLCRRDVLEKHIAIATQATADDPVADEDNGQQPPRNMITWPEVDAAVRRAIDRHHTGLDASVGVALGADVEFTIPGVCDGNPTKPSWMRRAYVAFDGAMTILPRQGGTKGDADWEVWLALRREDMDIIQEEGELGAWVCRVPL